MPQDKVLLLKTGKAVANELKQRRKGTALKIRLPWAVSTTTTGGWRAVLGRLGRQRLNIEIWLDRFTGPDQRKFWFGFISRKKIAMCRLAYGVKKQLRPQCVITEKDFGSGRIVALAKPLKRSQFGVPYFESYEDGWRFFGMYDMSVRTVGTAVNPHLCERIATFLESVARTLPGARPERAERGVYIKYENRKTVESHLRRERSHLLATDRKSKDDYICQVCGMSFEDVYGRLGCAFAEAHHLVPLSQLKHRVQTRIEDLRTVCSNCHSMLHRMDGKRDDLIRLRRRLRKHRRN